MFKTKKKRKSTVKSKNTFFKPYTNLLFISLLLLSLFSGGFYVYACSAVSVLFLICLIKSVRRTGTLRIYKGLPGIAVAVIVLSYLTVVFWATNGLGAISGFFKFLPVLLFTLLLFQQSEEEKRVLFMYVPFAGVLLTVITAPLYFSSSLKDTFYEYDRLNGGFGYANAFALFLLTGIVILLFRIESFPKKWIPLVLSLLLTAGIFLSGSRTVFVLLALVVLYFSIKIKPARRILLPSFVALVAVTAVYAVLTGNTDNLARFLTSFSDTDTLAVRFLYWRDALPVLMRNPFGTGFEGYSYRQLSFQTASYSNTFLHNDYLQLAFDVGIIPLLLFIASLGLSFFSKRTGAMQKLLIAVIAVHIFIDFDLQFTAIFCLLALCFDFGKEGKAIRLGSKAVYGAAGVSVLLGALCLWSFLGDYNERRGNYETALKFNPRLTYSEIMLLHDTESKDVAKNTAEHILSHNRYVTVAYDALALLAVSEGDYASAAQYSRQAVDSAKYIIEEYESYFSVLKQAYLYYESTGDSENAGHYKALILEIPSLIDNAKSSLSKEAYTIRDAEPDLALPAGTLSYIAELDN